MLAADFVGRVSGDTGERRVTPQQICLGVRNDNRGWAGFEGTGKQAKLAVLCGNLGIGTRDMHCQFAIFAGLG